MMSAVNLAAPLVLTAGEPAGIGPDLCVQLAQISQPHPLVVIADKPLLQQRAQLLGMELHLTDYVEGQQLTNSHHHLAVIHVPLLRACTPGKLDAENSQYVLATLRRAVQGCAFGKFSGMVTAPVHKGIINAAGIPFTGHTEFFAEQTNTTQVVMMLVGGGMRVALVTTHLPLREVSDAITPALLESVLCILRRDLQKRFGIPHPRIFVAGLNPHAGEAGYMGREEVEVMIPVLNKLRAEGFNVSAPLPADTLFTPHKLAYCDCVLTMYHDQGLPVLKHASFGQGVNVTLGLPVVRTSVDHGTALDLVGTGKAEVGSLLQAIQLAAEMVQHERA